MTPKTNDPNHPPNQNDKIRKENEESEEFDLSSNDVDDNPVGLFEDDGDESDNDCGCSGIACRKHNFAHGLASATS